MIKAIKNRMRLWVQIVFTAVTNGYLLGFLTGRIYTGPTKAACVPGLNCYSCPGALGSCPIGSLQAVLGSRDYKFSFYVVGFLLFFGSIFGRFVCGWLCPFGLVQDLLYKIPLFKKRKNLPGHKVLIWAKYVILVLFVILLPLLVVDFTGQGDPWFCKYICPSGTLAAGIPLVLLNENLKLAVGNLFFWKLYGFTGPSASICVLWALSTVSLIRWRCTDIRSMRAHVPNVENARRPARWISRYGRSRTAWNVFAAETA